MNGTNGFAGRPPLSTQTQNTKCPTCGLSIPREQFERILRISEARTKELADAQAAVEQEAEKLARERANIAQAAVSSEREKWEASAFKARAASEREAARLTKEIETTKERCARAHEKELQAEIKKREAAEKLRARELAAANAAAEKSVREAKRALEEKQGQVIADLRTQLKTLEQRRRRDEDALKKSIVDLQQKAEVRDSAHFGPEGEADMLQMLREHFPGDKIDHRGKGGDILHTVVDGGKTVATIIYEVKNRKSWQRGYLSQTKKAMEQHNTRYGILVTRAMPAGKSGMCVLSGVIVTVPVIAAQIVAVLRDSLLLISQLRLSESGKAAKMESLFDYLRGEEFRASIQRIQEKVVELRETLNREKSSHDGWWRGREAVYSAILREATGVDARVREVLGGQAMVAAPRAKVLGIPTPLRAAPDGE